MPFAAAFGGIDLGIGSAIGGGLASLGLDAIPTGLVTGALEGAGIGAAGSAITGGNPGIGALTGGLTGGTLGSGIGSVIGDATGIGATGGDILAGAGAGAVGSAVTGGNPLIGAAEGGGAGALSAALGPGTPSTTASPAAGVGGGGAASIGAPPAIASAAPDQIGQMASAATGISDSAPATAAPISGAGGGAPSNIISDVSAAGGNSYGTGGDATGAFGSTLTPAQVQTGWNTVAAGGGSPVYTPPNPLNSIGSFIKSNPALIGGGLLGAEYLMGNKPLPAQGQLQSEIGQNASAGRALQSYETTGTLPPGLQSTVDAATKANEAQIRSTFGRMGLAGSSSEAEALANAKTAGQASVAKIATDLFNQGLSLNQLSSGELQQLLTTQLSQSEDFSKALSSFAAGLAGAKLAA